MRFSRSFPSFSSALRSPTARRFALFALTLSALALGGACEDKHIGRSCELGTQATGMGGSNGGTVATIASPALECPSRICILPSGDSAAAANTGPLCTAPCDSNDDCDGEGGPKGNATDRHCENGFVCMWPTTVGDFACQKLCVCRDFVVEPRGGFQKPATCN
ncbi:MAG TPA: hypothetical protein VIF57_11350 [Polyangia bacterium]|jgi:hypothetical protein